jgi:hypothetical protein
MMPPAPSSTQHNKDLAPRQTGQGLSWPQQFSERRLHPYTLCQRARLPDGCVENPMLPEKQMIPKSRPKDENRRTFRPMRAEQGFVQPIPFRKIEELKALFRKQFLQRLHL